MKKTFWGMFLILTLFWLVVAGSFDLQIAATGALVSLFVVYFNRDILIYGDERPPLRLKNLLWLIMYAKDFLISVLKANLQVAYLVLNPRLPINPGIIRFNPGIRLVTGRVLLANSITLTPGTLTIFCTEEEMMVHALTEQNALGLLEWEVIEELRHMEED